MPKGSNIKKGMRPAGRKAGTPNKRTQEAILREKIPAQIAAEVQRGGDVTGRLHHALAKDVLDRYMHQFDRLAQSCRPIEVNETRPKGHRTNEKRFLTFAEMAIETGKALAKYQSPTFRAVHLVVPPAGLGPDALPPPGNDDKMYDDPQTLTRHYQRTMKLVKG